MATKTRLTLEQFLALPETEPPCEYITGELREKVSPNAFHAALAGELSRLLGNYLAETKLGRVFTELRHHSVALNRAYLPDISVILAPRVDEAFRQSGVAWPPDLAVEILSPDDRAADVLDKVDMYQQLDVALLWVVDPQARALREYRHGEAPRVHRSPSRVKAAPVLPGFELDRRLVRHPPPGGLTVLGCLLALTACTPFVAGPREPVHGAVGRELHAGC